MENKCILKFSLSTSKKKALGLLQFRIGSHNLPVNNRKHFKVPRADRHCTHCDQSLMGNEIHFLCECTKLNTLRVKYMSVFSRCHGLSVYPV